MQFLIGKHCYEVQKLVKLMKQNLLGDRDGLRYTYMLTRVDSVCRTFYRNRTH